MDYKNCCRTCLGNNKEMRSIDTSISIAGDYVRLSDILYNFYDYKVSAGDQYPGNICINCVHQLTITYSFKILIDANANKFTVNNSFADSLSDKYDCALDSDDTKEPPTEYYTDTKNLTKTNSTDVSIFCVECKSEFQSIRSLNEHCINNHPLKSIIGRDCDYCNEKFEDFRSLILHRKLHTKPYICENCWEGFLNVVDLRNHICQPNTHNQHNVKSSEKPLCQCDQCGKSYPPGYIKIHMLTHSSDRRYSCKYCPKKFKVPGGLHSHILWNHKRTRNHKCEVCNATFISSSSRSSHIRKNHLKEKKYACDSCGKRFFSKSELQRHNLTHTGVKNFHCHLCDKSYQTRYGLNVHLKSHSQLSSISVLNL